uniref:Uncharacterized protein n=1 Tax=Parascaris univalens TaxID=6257 RepID=A0A915ASF3_PARUN
MLIHNFDLKQIISTKRRSATIPTRNAIYVRSGLVVAFLLYKPSW